MKRWMVGVGLVLSLLPLYVHAQVASRVILVGDPPALCQRIGEDLTAVLREINRIAEQKGKYDVLRAYCTEEGFRAVRELAEINRFYATRAEYRTSLLRLSDGWYEVRGIMVKVYMKGTKGNPFQELVVTLNPEGRICDVRYAMELRHYQNIIEDGKKLDDMAYREQILQFLEIFRTAYNRKDLAYLEKAYSEDALIIVGKVIRKAENSSRRIGLEHSTLSPEKIRLVRLSKKQYIHGLREAFKINAFVKVSFDSVGVRRHPERPRVYGITLKQRWNSSTYSDEGYLFLMIDFRDEAQPLVHVRAWQPQPFEDHSVINLGDFEIY